MNTEFKGTKGEFKSLYASLRDFTLCSVVSEERVVAHINSEDVTPEECKANSELIADAFNTIQSCGLLPSELLKQRDELRDFLRIIISSEMTPISYRKTAKKLLESTEVKAV